MRFTINGQTVVIREGATILQAARSAGIEIPTLCYLEGVSDIGSCRLCVVEVEGTAPLVPACNTKAKEGMVVRTDTPPCHLRPKDRPGAAGFRTQHRLLQLRGQRQL